MVFKEKYQPNKSRIEMKIDIREFENQGYLIIEDVIPEDYIIKLKKEVNNIIFNNITAYKSKLIRDLVESKFNLNIADSLLGEKNYVFHHVNAAIHTKNNPNLCWHHDYEDYTGNRKFKMIHIFYYLNGLNNSIGELLLLPGSHKESVSRYEYAEKSFDFFNEKIVTINTLKPGSIIVINSALIHARRALPYLEGTPERYFIDCSFCEYGGKWAPFRELGNWYSIINFLNKESSSINAKKYDYLYDSSKFYISLKDKIIDGLNIRSQVNYVRGILSGKVKKQFK